jgi:hypothetical protein
MRWVRSELGTHDKPARPNRMPVFGVGESPFLFERLKARRAARYIRWLVPDHENRGNWVEIDIDNASRKVDLKRLVLSKLPAKVETSAG